MSGTVIQFPVDKIKSTPTIEYNPELVDLIDVTELIEIQTNQALATMIMSLDEDGVDADHEKIQALIYSFKMDLLNVLTEMSNE